MSTPITTEIARIDEYENAENPKTEENSNKTEPVMNSEDKMSPELISPDPDRAIGSDDGSALDKVEAAITEEISVTDSAASIMPDDDLVPPAAIASMPENSSLVDPAHALIVEDEAVAKSADSVYLDDASVINSVEPMMPDAASIADSANESWQSLQSDTKTFVEDAISATTAFFKNNRQLWTVLGAIFLAIISAKLLFAGLDAVEGIPLVAPLLKIIGLVYLVRFVSRYLIRQSDRQELVEKIEHTKAEVLGN